MDKNQLINRILGDLPKHWQASELRNLCTYIQRGTSPSYVEHSEMRALNQRAIRWGRIEEDNLKFHDEDVRIASRHMIGESDIVLNSTGDITIGRAYLFTATPKQLFADSHVTIIRTNKSFLSPEYLVNLLATPEYQDLIYSMVTGSTGQLELNKSNVEQLPILLPPIEIQKTLVDLMTPLYQSITECDAMRHHCEEALQLLLSKYVLDPWKASRWNDRKINNS